MRPSNQLKKLTKEWYKILKRTGFEDIEHDEYNLKRASRSHAAPGQNSGTDISVTLERQAITAEYFRLAGFFLNDHTFECPFDEYLWTQHAAGLSYRDIYKKLLKDEWTGSSISVWHRIYDLKKEMLARYRGVP